MPVGQRTQQRRKHKRLAAPTTTNNSCIITVGVSTTEKEINDSGKPSLEELHDRYGLNRKPGCLNYREAVLVAPEDPSVFPVDAPEYEKVRLLAARDREFSRRLQQDKEFHDICWCRIKRGRSWTPKSSAEELARKQIDEAITDRMELVLAQKTLLGKYFHLLSDAEKERLLEKVDVEIGFSEQWMSNDMPNYKTLHEKFLSIFPLDFVVGGDDDDDPSNPACSRN